MFVTAPLPFTDPSKRLSVARPFASGTTKKGRNFDSYPAVTYYSQPDAYYNQSDVYIERPTQRSYTAPAPQPKAQYYCPDSGYYPSVQTCPRGWLRVVPDGAPPS